jgi:hypothetical protein
VEPFYPTGIRSLFGQFWGRVVMGDFGVSLLFTAAWFLAVARTPSPRLALGAANLVLGNPVLLGYLAVRALSAKQLRDVFLPPAVA